jgi:glucose/arabinose dehydrogenase
MAAVLGSGVSAQTISYENAFASVNFSRPVVFTPVPGMDSTFLVVEQIGKLQIVKRQGGIWAKTEFAAIAVNIGTDLGDEKGLLGFAFHPQYATNRKYYVYFMTASGGSAAIIQERLADQTLLKDAGESPRQLLRLTDPEGNHNGGTMDFAKDGFLYISIGDGGGGDDLHNLPLGNGQDKNTLFGKMLRIDVNTKANGKEYGIPADNPFAVGGGAPEVFAWGLRNPWKWSFDPLNGDLWAGDVGQNRYEEVDIIKKGMNYGWRVAEGNHCRDTQTPCTLSDYTAPVYDYSRAIGSCVTGGVVYRGIPTSPYYGSFIFGDYGGREIWALKANGQVTALTPLPSGIGTSSFGTDNKGQVYVMGVYNSTIYRMVGLGAGTTVIGKGYLRDKMRGTFLVAPGSRLHPDAFHASATLDIHSLDGARMSTLSRAAPVISADMQAGMYLAKPTGFARPSLLIVR